MKVDYYSEVGSYRGAVKLGGKWVSVKNLNYADKRTWVRRQGPPTPAIAKAMKEKPVDARDVDEWEKRWK